MAAKGYPMKWGIMLHDKMYIQVYGKKRAYELLYSLSSCVNGLYVMPVAPKLKKVQAELSKSGEYYKKWRAKNKEKIRAYQREYRSKQRNKS